MSFNKIQKYKNILAFFFHGEHTVELQKSKRPGSVFIFKLWFSTHHANENFDFASFLNLKHQFKNIIKASYGCFLYQYD